MPRLDILYVTDDLEHKSPKVKPYNRIPKEMPLILAETETGRSPSEFKASLVYTESYRSAMATE